MIVIKIILAILVATTVYIIVNVIEDRNAKKSLERFYEDHPKYRGKPVYKIRPNFWGKYSAEDWKLMKSLEE